MSILPLPPLLGLQLMDQPKKLGKVHTLCLCEAAPFLALELG